MTHEERIAAVYAMGEKIRLFVESIETPPMPELPDKPGSVWKLAYTFGESSYAWELVEIPDAPGTRENPFMFTPGMTVKVNYWYTDGVSVYVCIQSGTADDFEVGDYFEIVGNGGDGG